jgi:dienelactone hydrolase
MKNHYWIGVVTLLTIAFHSLAQETYQFTQGLAVGGCHQYGREALYTDQLAFQLYNGLLQKPTEGQIALTRENGKSSAWKALTANQAHKFKDSTLANGYLYLTYESDREQVALLNVTGHSMLYFNGQPRTGDIYASGWLNLPVQLKKGLNELYVRGSRFSVWEGITAQLTFSPKPLSVHKEDPTLPHLVLGQATQPLWGAVVLINASAQPMAAVQLTSRLEGKEVVTTISSIPPMTIRKVGFRLDGGNVRQKGTYPLQISISQKGQLLDKQELKVEAVEAHEHQSHTFVSEIDGSVQYYGVAPPSQPNLKSPALFLSVHGAGVEAIGQARAYQPKSWGVVLTPTNRRPRGFNWEDWGRIDALEVLELGKKQFNPDPQRIYLTGHSMGGHGSWYLGATYPGKWAAIAPCAGYPSLAAYGSADGKIPEAGKTGVEKLLHQASNGSNVFELAKNYQAGGIYIHHGDSDKVVSVDYARQMRQLLGTFHQDFSYYEYPGGSHWFGNESVDWAPIFDYFKWHTIPADSAVNKIDFSTANPAISSQFHWAAILQQQQGLKHSRMQLNRNKATKIISGSTENASVLRFSLNDFQKGDTLTFRLDDQPALQYVVPSSNAVVYLHRKGNWQLGTVPSSTQKGISRNGTFKEPFHHRMVFVYGTTGQPEENQWSYQKARYDAEVWYYRGNGAVDIVADKDFSPAAYAHRGVVLYGNASTNGAWKKLLARCPIQVKRGEILVGKQKYAGDDLGAYFMWPRADSEVASVAVVTGSGLKGMRAADANQYFAAGSGFPDYMVFSLRMLQEGAKGVKAAGFYGNDWSLEKGESVVGE